MRGKLPPHREHRARASVAGGGEAPGALSATDAMCHCHRLNYDAVARCVPIESTHIKATKKELLYMYMYTIYMLQRFRSTLMEYGNNAQLRYLQQVQNDQRMGRL